MHHNDELAHVTSNNLSLFGDIFRNKKVLVTRNTDFKGSWLSVGLLTLGAKVYRLSTAYLPILLILWLRI